MHLKWATAIYTQLSLSLCVCVCVCVATMGALVLFASLHTKSASRRRAGVICSEWEAEGTSAPSGGNCVGVATPGKQKIYMDFNWLIVPTCLSQDSSLHFNVTVIKCTEYLIPHLFVFLNVLWSQRGEHKGKHMQYQFRLWDNWDLSKIGLHYSQYFEHCVRM